MRPSRDPQPVDLLVAELAAWTDAGQSELAFAIRRLLHRAAPALFALLDFEDDDAFLEPLGFLHFSAAPTADPTPIYCAYVAPDRRPDLAISLDASGGAYVPRLGTSALGAPHGHVALCWDGTRYVLDGVPAPWDSLPALSGIGANVAGASVRALDGCFADDAGRPLRARPASPSPHQLASLDAAVAALQDGAPAVHEIVGSVARLVVLFDDARLNSFATPRAHGVAFLNTSLGDSVPAFVDDLTHQFGHTLFTAAARDGDRYLRIPGDTSLGSLTGEPRDTRPLLVALHGLVTEALIVGALDGCLRAARFADADVDEALGRVAFVGRRLATDLANFAAGDMLTDAGRALVARMADVHAAARERHGAAITAADLSGQGYNFDLARYRLQNGARAARAR